MGVWFEGILSLMVGKSWWPEPTAGHMTPTVRSQTEMNAGAQLASSVLNSFYPVYDAGL